MLEQTKNGKTTAMAVTAIVMVVAALQIGAVAFGAPEPTDGEPLVCEGALASELCTAWTARYDGPRGAHDIANAIAVAPEGDRVYVTGWTAPGATGSDYATVAYDAQTGEEIWASIYGPGTGINNPHAITLSPDGGQVYVTGESRTAKDSGDRHYDTVAYDAGDGTQLWVTRYDGPGSGHDIAHDIVASPDNTTVFVTGQSAGDGTFDDFATVAYNTTDGNELWVQRYNGPLDGNDRAVAVGLSPDGSTLFVTGQSATPDQSIDYTTIAYEAVTGEQSWITHYNGPVDSVDIPTSLQVSPDGGHLFVTGHSVGTNTGADYTTVKYDVTEGNELWVARYDGPANGYDIAAALDSNPTGSVVYVTGSSPGVGTSRDYATVAHDADTGDQLWTARYNGEGNGKDEAAAIGVSPDGATVYVTGESLGDDTGTADSLTVAYDAVNGTELWNARAYDPLAAPMLNDYTCPLGISVCSYGYDGSTALAVNPESALVYVTGFAAADTRSGYNFQTIAYGAVSPPSVGLPPNPTLPPLPVPPPSI